MQACPLLLLLLCVQCAGAVSKQTDRQEGATQNVKFPVKFWDIQKLSYVPPVVTRSTKHKPTVRSTRPTAQDNRRTHTDSQLCIAVVVLNI